MALPAGIASYLVALRYFNRRLRANSTESS
jgi:hypothetical protein